MKDIHKVDSIFFDMDGTLWDGVGCYAQGFNEFFKLKNIKKRFSKKDLYGWMGWEEDAYLRLVLPEFSYQERKSIYKEVIRLQYKQIKSGGGQVYPDVKEGLSQLSLKFKLFIVSNCPEFTIDHFMDWAGIRPYITDSMAHGANLRPKHENLKHLIDQYSLKAPVYVGDTDSDRIQAGFAEIPFVYVSYGFGQAAHYDLKFDSFLGLTDYFDRKNK